jgi:hypothetical protein
MPFCQGLRNEVRLGMILVAFIAAITSNPNFRSRSKIKYLREVSKGNASRNCWVIQTARRTLRDVNVQDAPPIMTDDEEAIEHAERNRWHREEIHGGNRFPMVAKEG